MIVPAVLGWMNEKRLPPGERWPKCSVCAEKFADPVQAPVFKMALQIGLTSLALGLMSTFFTADNNPVEDSIEAELIKASIVLFCALVVGFMIWWNLSDVGDGTGNLGKCAMYVYLRTATTPGASVMFYWYHIDDSHDTCGPIDEDDDPNGCEDLWNSTPGSGWDIACAADPTCEVVAPEWYVFDAVCFVYTSRRLNDLSNDCRYGWCPTEDCPECLAWEDCEARRAIGQSCAQDGNPRPCLTATFLGNITIAGYLMLSVSVAMYNKWLSGWNYRTVSHTQSLRPPCVSGRSLTD